jgi:cytochrome P450
MSTLSDAAPVPAHIPLEAVYDFDMRLDPGLLADPHKRVSELLDKAGGLFWSPRNGGRWIALGYPEIYEAARDPERFSSSLMSGLPKMPPLKAAMTKLMIKFMRRFPSPKPITLDPPLHGKFRAPLQKTFSPKAAMARMEEIRTLCDDLIDRVIAQGHCDFIPAIAEPLPVTVFLKMMGLPVERLGEFRALVHEFLAGTSSDPLTAAKMIRKVADAMTGEIKARRDNPKDDIISLLWQTEIDGEPMTLELMEDYCVLLFIAGLDTVINGMGFAVRHLAMNPDLQDKLRAEPELITEAVEEMLRRYSFAIPMRRVTKDTVLAGRQLNAGDVMALFIPGSGLDAREFVSPEQFDLARETKVHLAFGAGPHRCLGAHLARVELQVLYQQLLKRLPSWRLDPDKPAKFHSGNIIAVDSLPIRWD